MNILRLTITMLLIGLLVACGGGPVPVPPAEPSELDEIIGANGEADAEVRLEVIKSFKPATITTQFNPEIGGQTVYEVAGTTPKGKPFKAVLLGDEGINLAEFRANARIQARLRRIQGQAVLAGRMIPTGPLAGQHPIAFVATGQNVRFNGPAAGSVYQLKGMADFKGVCAENGLSGSYSFKQGTVELTGALTGLRERGKALACQAGTVEAQTPVALSYTAVETHMGTVFALQGSLVTGATSSGLISLVGSAMPSQGLAIPAASLPATTMRATSTLKSNVKELGNTSGAELVSFNATDGTMIFNRLTGNLGSLAVNEIISSAPRTNAPNGFLRKVTRIQNTNDGKVEVRTAKAHAADLLDEADISVEQEFSSADVQRASALEHGKVIYAASQMQPSMQAMINETFGPIVLYDKDGNQSTTDDQVTVSGKFKVAPKVVTQFKCRKSFCSDPYFLGKFVLDQEAEVTVSAKLKKELRESMQIVRIPLPAITAGPLVFVPDIVVTVDIEGEVRVEVEVGATQNMHLEAGVEYDGGFKKINDSDTDVGIIGPTVEGSVEVKAGIYAALRLMLYGVAGVSAEAGPYAKFEAQYPRQPYWTMTYGIEGNLGVDVDLILFRKEWEVKLFDKIFDNKTKTAPNERPKFLEIGSRYVCDDGFTARGLAPIGGGLANIELYALTDDKEDGLGTGTIDWSSSRDGSLGRTRKADKHIIRFPLRNGNPHTITAVLTDSQGATRTKEFEVKLNADKCQFPLGFPNVNITSDDNPNGLPIPPIVSIAPSGSLTLRATTNLNLIALCGTDKPITWKSNLAGGNAGTSTGVLETVTGGSIPQQVCNHTFTHTYKNLGDQTITAKFTHNGLTVTDSIDVSQLYPLPLSIGNIQFTAPSATRYVYEGDQVSFEATGSDLVWSSSVASDNINGKTGNSVNGRFNTIGPRTIVARASNSDSSFGSKSVTINVLSALAKP
jgi:hypothetical protein